MAAFEVITEDSRVVNFKRLSLMPAQLKRPSRLRSCLGRCADSQAVYHH